MQAHDVAWTDAAAAHLDDEIGAAREEAAVGAEGGAHFDGFSERGWLVVFEAHLHPECCRLL
jgi:hypothetical protein